MDGWDGKKRYGARDKGGKGTGENCGVVDHAVAMFQIQDRLIRLIILVTPNHYCVPWTSTSHACLRACRMTKVIVMQLQKSPGQVSCHRCPFGQRQQASRKHGTMEKRTTARGWGGWQVQPKGKRGVTLFWVGACVPLNTKRGNGGGGHGGGSHRTIVATAHKRETRSKHRPLYRGNPCHPTLSQRHHHRHSHSVHHHIAPYSSHRRNSGYVQRALRGNRQAEVERDREWIVSQQVLLDQGQRETRRPGAIMSRLVCVCTHAICHTSRDFVARTRTR